MGLVLLNCRRLDLSQFYLQGGKTKCEGYLKGYSGRRKGWWKMEQPKLASLFATYLSCRSFTNKSVEIKSRAVKYFVELFGDIEPENITYNHAEDYVNFLRKERKAGAVNAYLRNIKPFFVWLVRRGHTKSNPFEQIRLLPEDKIYRPPYSGDELARLIKVADLRMKVITLLALCSSMRRTEILNLVVKDIYFDRSCILINPKEETETTWRWTIKNHQHAFVPMPETIELPGETVNLHNLIVQLIETLPAKQPYLCLKAQHYEVNMRLKAEGRLTDERRLTPWLRFSNDFKRLCKRATIESKSLKDLRATFATTLAESNYPLTKTQKAMRHKSPQTTANYYIQHDQCKIINEVNELSQNYYVTTVP
ncbi:MAG: site-specific integrase [Phycisphaerae bacterium]|nr:site-specific integrase [Phycisphaerae bacterium]